MKPNCCAPPPAAPATPTWKRCWPPPPVPGPTAARRVDSLRFEPGRLTLNAAGLLPQQVDAMRERLAPAGWVVQANGSQITFSRTAAAKS